MGSSQDTLILYTNRRCPWAHRAHIALEELQVPYEEVTIDLDTPRTAEYLAINPRGLVPALSVNGEVIIESAIVANFLTNAYDASSHLLPASNAPGGALRRARIDLFVDAFVGKFQGALFKLHSAKTEAEVDAVVESAVEALVREVEPKLKDASPFFGGSERLTQAEVLTGSFVIRLLSLSRADIYPQKILLPIQEKAPNFYKWAEAVAVHPSVTAAFDEASIIASAKARLAKLRAAA